MQGAFAPAPLDSGDNTLQRGRAISRHKYFPQPSKPVRQRGLPPHRDDVRTDVRVTILHQQTAVVHDDMLTEQMEVCSMRCAFAQCGRLGVLHPLRLVMSSAQPGGGSRPRTCPASLASFARMNAGLPQAGTIDVP